MSLHFLLNFSLKPSYGLREEFETSNNTQYILLLLLPNFFCGSGTEKRCRSWTTAPCHDGAAAAGREFDAVGPRSW